MTDARIVITTTGNRADAEKIANALVERELAACVNIVGPITSVYRWQGQIENAQEFLLLIKTWEDAYERVEAAIGEMHPYDLPEVVAVRVAEGSAKYIEWIESSVKSAED